MFILGRHIFFKVELPFN